MDRKDKQTGLNGTHKGPAEDLGCAAWTNYHFQILPKAQMTQGIKYVDSFNNLSSKQKPYSALTTTDLKGQIYSIMFESVVTRHIRLTQPPESSETRYQSMGLSDT